MDPENNEMELVKENIEEEKITFIPPPEPTKKEVIVEKKERKTMNLSKDCLSRLKILSETNKCTKEEWITKIVDNYYVEIEKKQKKDKDKISEQTLLKLKAIAHYKEIPADVWIDEIVKINCPHTEESMKAFLKAKKEKKKFRHSNH